MKVFKFGGASVKDADAVRNVASILALYPGENLIVVVSAMGKTTNRLEKILDSWFQTSEKLPALFEDLKDYHFQIAGQLFEVPGHAVFEKLNRIFSSMEEKLTQPSSGDYDFHYDQLVSLGELLSSIILFEYLKTKFTDCGFYDARTFIRTDNTWREGKVDWEATTKLAWEHLLTDFQKYHSGHIAVTQGFIGGTRDNFTTTLGREGSDYSAAILSYVSDAESMTVWKDVPGVLNADPKYFSDTQLLKQISYREAIELTYYGASVIHPKTIKPLQNKGIPLFVKSFLEPSAEGTVIGTSSSEESKIPSVILKFNQVLISISPKDFSFIAEQNLSEIFAAFASAGIRIHMMQNSAISFSACITDNPSKMEKLLGQLGNKFEVKYNRGLHLITIRHYNNEIAGYLLQGKKLLMEQRSRSTAQFVIKETV